MNLGWKEKRKRLKIWHIYEWLDDHWANQIEKRKFPCARLLVFNNMSCGMKYSLMLTDHDNTIFTFSLVTKQRPKSFARRRLRPAGNCQVRNLTASVGDSNSWTSRRNALVSPAQQWNVRCAQEMIRHIFNSTTSNDKNSSDLFRAIGSR